MRLAPLPVSINGQHCVKQRLGAPDLGLASNAADGDASCRSFDCFDLKADIRSAARLTHSGPQRKDAKKRISAALTASDRSRWIQWPHPGNTCFSRSPGT